MTDSDLKIAFAFDQESQSYLDYVMESTLKEWGVENEGRVTHGSHRSYAGRTIFGELPTLILNLETKDAVRETLAYLKTKSDDELSDRFASGLFIRTHQPLNTTKGLREHLIERGVLVLSKNAKERGKLPEELLKELNLDREVERFLLDFALGNPDVLMSVIRDVKKLQPHQQKKLTVESLVPRLPDTPEGAPPWDIEEPFWSGDTRATLATKKRITVTPDLNVVLLWQLRKTSRMVLDLAGMHGARGYSRAELGMILGVQPNYGITVAQRHAKKVGLEKAMKVAELVREYDHKIRGGSRLNIDMLMEMLLIRATIEIRKS